MISRRVPRSLAPFLLAVWLAQAMTAGVSGAETVVRRDGTPVAGPFTLEAGGKVALSDGTVVSLGELQAARFHPPGAVQSRGTGLLATYFSTVDLRGKSVVRIDPMIQATWSGESPAPRILPDRFSVRWEGEIEAVVSGLHQFRLAANRGRRLWIDGRPLIDQWPNRQEEGRGEIELQAGRRYPIRCEIAMDRPLGSVRLSWSAPGLPPSVVPEAQLYPAQPPNPAINPAAEGWHASYFTNVILNGKALERIDPEINFDWKEGSPAPGIGRDQFSVHWSGLVTPPVSGSYALSISADDGFRLWIDQQLVMDAWHEQAASEHRATVEWVAGKTSQVDLEYYEGSGLASVRLLWAPPGNSMEPLGGKNVRPGPLPLSVPASAGMPAGIVLVDGSILAGTVISADASSLSLKRPGGTRSISIVNVAAIVASPGSGPLRARIAAGDPGVLLANGDFVDGEMKGIGEGRLRASSILFGVQRFDWIGQAAAVVLRPLSPATAPWRVELLDGSRIACGQPDTGPHELLIDHRLAGPLKVPEAEVAVIERAPPR